MQRTFFITGTDTGVGKTTLTALLAAWLRGRGVAVAAFKPICSGGRADARLLRTALGGALALDEINPWHFSAPIAPTLAARRERKSVSLTTVVAHIRATGKKFDAILVEGAGGLLSPLGEGFDSRALMIALRAEPIIVAPNRLGVVNHLLLTREALPNRLRAKASVVLMSPPKPDAATAANTKLLAQWVPPARISKLPWLGNDFALDEVLKKTRVRQILRKIY